MALRFTRRGGRGRETGQDSTSVPLAPLIDMIFILLIFFLVTASFVKETGVDVKKPRSYTGHLLSKEGVVVTIKGNGNILVGKRNIELGGLVSHIERRLDETDRKEIIIASDRNVRTALLVQVMDRCKQAGADSISLATRRK